MVTIKLNGLPAVIKRSVRSKVNTRSSGMLRSMMKFKLMKRSIQGQRSMQGQTVLKLGPITTFKISNGIEPSVYNETVKYIQ